MFWWELRRFCPLIMWSGLHIKRISRRQQLRLWICSPAHGKFTFYTFLLKTCSMIWNYIKCVLIWFFFPLSGSLVSSEVSKMYGHNQGKLHNRWQPFYLNVFLLYLDTKPLLWSLSELIVLRIYKTNNFTCQDKCNTFN